MYIYFKSCVHLPENRAMHVDICMWNVQCLCSCALCTVPYTFLCFKNEIMNHKYEDLLPVTIRNHQTIHFSVRHYCRLCSVSMYTMHINIISIAIDPTWWASFSVQFRSSTKMAFVSILLICSFGGLKKQTR